MQLSGSLFLCLIALVIFPLGQTAAGDDHESHSSHSSSHNLGHSDALMVLLQHKIALQKLQGQEVEDQKSVSSANLEQQAEHIQQVMPVLQGYMNTPKSYYLTTEMYHDSLENRAAMLADFSKILVRYQKQLVSPP